MNLLLAEFSSGTIALIVVGVIAVLFLMYAIGVYNSLVGSSEFRCAQSACRASHDLRSSPRRMNC